MWIYVANTDSVVRFPYTNGDLRATEKTEIITSLPPGRWHWTRDIAFSEDDSKMFISVGSASNAAESTENSIKSIATKAGRTVLGES